MAMGKKTEQLFNEQINAEMGSSYLYLGMAGYFEDNNLKGIAAWMKKQAGEEMGHAMKFFDHMVDRRTKPLLQDVKAPPKEWKSPLNAFEVSLSHEQLVTSMINKLMDTANAEKDNASASFLKWFVDEQVEEEAQTDEIVQKLKMVKDNSAALYLLDKELGERK